MISGELIIELYGLLYIGGLYNFSSLIDPVPTFFIHMNKSNQHHTKKVTFFVPQKNEVIQVWDDMTENNDNSYFG